MDGFTGFPEQALDFYDDLEVENTRAFFTEHRATYDACVRAPMIALCAELGAEFGEAKVFRPHRDVRFAKDKSPYKTHQGAFVAVAPRTGWYVEIAAPGMRVAAGIYDADSAQLARIRHAIDDDRTGQELERVVADLERQGYTISGEQLRTAPRGWTTDHPRIALLRHKQLVAGRHYGFEGLDDPALVDRVRADWRAMRPLLDWLHPRAAP